MSPVTYSAVVEDIPEYGTIRLEAKPTARPTEEDGGVRGENPRFQAEGRHLPQRRPHSTDQRRTSRGRPSRRISDPTMLRPRPERTPQRYEEVQDSSDSGSDTEETPEADRFPRSRTKYVSGPPALPGPSGASGSTITTDTAFAKQRADEDARATHARPDVLSFLQQDSPAVTRESIRRAVVEAGGAWSPRSASSGSSSGSSSGPSESTDMTSPDRSIDGDATGAAAVPAETRSGRQKQLDIDVKSHRYGTPEMSRGSAKHPHLPPNELTPRVANPNYKHPKHLPRAEKLPMTGYELLASKLSNSGSRPRRRSGSSASSSSPTDKPERPIKPIYRRFEALNHRLLLHLQDELSELEEQLHRLDTADTQTRRLQNCILPASRRRESMTGGELQWHKTDILGKIGYKLGQYNHVLTSFTEAQNLTAASMTDIEDYRTYLATENPIAEIETRFLDPAEDLVCLAPTSRNSSPEPGRSYSPFSEDVMTPMPQKISFGSTGQISRPSTRASSRQDDTSPCQSQLTEPSESSQLTTAAAPNAMLNGPVVAGLAIMIWLITFPLITDFSGRIAVVLVTTIAVAALKRNLEMAS